MIIRPVKLEEVEDLQKIAIDTFVMAFASENTLADMELYLEKAFNKERLKTALKNKNTYYFFALINNDIVGYLKLNVDDAQTENQFSNGLEIERIYVVPSAIGKGIGQQMIDHAIDNARKFSKSMIWLGVWEHNPRAIRFYERNGFKIFSSHPYMMGTDEQTDYLMKREIL